MDLKLFSWGILIFLLGLIISQVGYYIPYIPTLQYLSFSSLVFALLVLFSTMIKDIKQELNSYLLASFLTLFIVSLYFLQRQELHRFDFFIADASDYYLAGVNAVLNGGDQGFFMPMTSAVSAVGFSIFGYENGPLIIVIIYAAVIPLSYFIFRYLKLNTILSYTMVIFTISAPVSIWFSKSTYSESIWQIELLLFIILVYSFLQHEKIKTIDYLSFLLLLILVSFTRGEASLLYGVIIFLFLIYFWKYHNIKITFLLAISSVMLALSIHYTIALRTHYLLKWQYARIIPEVTEFKLMVALYSVSFMLIIFLFILNSFKLSFFKMKFPIIITFLAIIIKITIAYIYSIKKAAIAHTLLFKNALGFSNFLIMNELGFAYDNFGLLLTILIAIGLIFLHISAIKGHMTALIILIIYVIFSLPFVMQSVSAKDIHEIFLYWHRYYFSIIIMVHIFGLGLLLKFIYDFMGKIIINTQYKYLFLLIMIFSVVFFSMDSKMYTIVTQEAYLKNSQKLMPWLKKRIGRQPLAIVYDEEIKYKLHHNREYDAKILTYRTFPIERINTKSYQKVAETKLNSTLIFNPKISKCRFLLCLSKEKCELANNKLLYVDTLVLPIAWREHYGIHSKDKKIHHNKLTESIQNKFTLHATLYKIK
jgi:hypothetical protein